MAGVVEESTPFSFNLQADSLRSGSISFGRYENEALCWERRSSFSHNRYLEEVEKYSRPGSVTEKKAYFEAHFRKRALMRQTSSRSHNGTDYQSNENDSDEYEFESFRERSYSARFDESPVSSISEQDVEEAECIREHTGTSYADHQRESVLDNILDSEKVNSQEIYQAEIEDWQTEVEDLPIVNNEPEIGAIENLTAEARTSNMVFKAVDWSASDHQAEADNGVSSERHEDPSNQVKIESQTKSKIKSQVTGAQGKTNTSNGASKDVASKPIRKEVSVPLQSKRENKVSGAPSVTVQSSHKMQKHEVPCYSKTKANFFNKSADIESRTRTKNSLRSASEKAAPKANPTAQWPKKGVSSTPKPRTRQNGSAFSFKSDNRAETKKELVEKMRSEEGESQQLRAKIQGASSDRKSSKPRSKSSISGVETSEPLNKTDPPHVSEPSSFPRTSRAPSAAKGATRATQAGAVNLMTRKKEQPKETNVNVQKYKVLEGSKVTKGQKIEGKPKTNPGRSTASVIRKEMKGVHLGSSSRMGHLAVGVAS